MAKAKNETTEETPEVSPDVEYLERNYDNAAQVDYLAQNTPGESVTAPESTAPDAVDEAEVPTETTTGKPVVVLEPGEHVEAPASNQ